MKWVGLTGSIASGKTTVSNILKGLSIPVLDADQMAHQGLKNNQDRILTYFGPDILGDNGLIDRKKLGDKIFSDERLKKALEGIIHPFVQEKVKEKKRLLEVAGHPISVYDVPLLFEKKLEEQFDHVLVVYIPESLSLERLMNRNNLSQEEAEMRLKNQMNIETKKERANTVLNNEGDIDALKEQVRSWLETYSK